MRMPNGWYRKFIDRAAEFGGVLTFNWHDRSIAPERLWDGFYLKLLGELKSRGAWFATAAQTVSWFRNRRLAVVEKRTGGQRKDQNQGFGRVGRQLARTQSSSAQTRNAERRGGTPAQSSPAFVDMAFKEKIDTEISL